MEIKEIIEILTYILSLVGLLATVYKTIEVWINLRKFSWKDVENLSRKLIREISRDGFVPDVIVGIGRGGAITGALLSGNLPFPDKRQNIPLLGVDRLYKWEKGCRIEIKNEMINFHPLQGKKVLLVASDIMTGGTMEFFLEQLRDAGVKEVRTACLVKNISAAFRPDYYGKEILGDFRMPWMQEGYIRDSRRPPVKAQQHSR